MPAGKQPPESNPKRSVPVEARKEIPDMASFPRILESRSWQRAARPGMPVMLAVRGMVMSLMVSMTISITGLLAGCPAAGDDLQPPRDNLVFPTGLAVSPDASRLFAVSANSDLRWSSGSVLAVDLELIDGLVRQWLALPLEPGKCQGQEGPLANDWCACDLDDPRILSCAQTLVMDEDAGVRVGNFATDIAVQDLGTGELRLFVPVRGDPSVTFIDYRAGELQCDGSGEGFPLCDNHRVLGFYAEPERTLRAEPFGVFVDSDSEFAVVTHLQRAAVSLLTAPVAGTPALVDEMNNLFSGDNFGVQAAIGVAGRRVPDPAQSTLLYVTSRTDNRVQMLSVAPGQDGELPRLVPAGFFFLTSVAPSTDSRDIAFNADGTRAYIVNRNPPMLHVLDTATTPEGTPRNEIRANIELCREPANLAVGDPVDGTRVYVACFPDGQVWAIDPEAGVVEAIITTGTGPHALAADAQRKRLYVANFLDHSLAVIELDPASPARNQVVLRLRSSEEGEN
jgi:DNA-binding beta-propeller fold protein YncE